MKRIISLMLSIMLALSGITVANADATADGIGINRWNGFAGDGVTTLNPTDNSDDVVKLTTGEETTLTLDSAVSGNMLITVEFYAEATQNSTITALASDGTTVMGSFALANDKIVTGKWQTAKILVYPGGKMYRTYLGDTYLGEGSISTASLTLGKIKITAGGTLYINNISVYDYTTPVLEDSKLRTVYSSDFSGTTSTTTKISSLDGWSANASDETIGYYLVPDPKNSSENAVKVERTAVNSSSTNRFAKGINFANSVYEMKMYIPSKLSDGTTDNPANFKMFMRTDNSVNPTVIWIRSNGATTVGIPEVGRFTAPLDEWFTLKLNINMDAQTIDVYVGDEKVSDVPISLLKADGTPATKCTEIDLEVPREADSGIAYVKDISIKEQNPVKVAANVDKTMIYEQDFDDETVGATVPGFTLGLKTASESSSLTFATAAAGTAGASSKIGMLYDPTYLTGTSVYRYNDAGETDENVKPEDSKTTEWWYYDISDSTANLDNITLSFKYYNAKNAGNAATQSSALSRDHLLAGFATGEGLGDMYYKDNSLAIYLKPGNLKAGLMQKDNNKGTNVAANSTKTWTDISLTVTKNADDTATAKIASGTTVDTYSLDSFPTVKRLSFQLEEAYGGKYYIDDIEVYTAEYTEEILYTDSEFKDISTAVTVPVYTNTITRDNVSTFTIDGINFSDGTGNVSAENSVSSVDVTQWKDLDADEDVWLYTAAYDTEGRLLTAQKQELTAQTLTEKVTVDVSDISCEGAEYVKAFIWSDDLTPLAEGYFVGKKITVWIAGSSTAQDYPAERYPQAGWGQMIDPYFYENSVTINNKAVGGRSSKSFIQEGRLDEILASGQSGDYLMIYFGGNDASKEGMLEYTDPTLGWDVVDSNPDGYSANASYKYYLKQYVDGAKEKGMIPVFVTVLPMFGYKDGEYVGGNYAINHVNAMIDLGEELGVPVANLNTPFDNAMASMGEEKAKKHFMIFKFADFANDPKFSPDYHIASGNYDAETDLYVDNVHINELGADLCAQIIADAIKDMPIGLSNYVK